MQPHILNLVYLMNTSQAVWGWPVRTVVKRASGNAASHSKPSILCVLARQCEAGLKLVHTVVKRASGNAASHCKPSILCVLARQCEAGLKLVPTLVKRASSYPASHYKPSILCVLARQCEAGLKLVPTLVRRASSYPASYSNPHILCVLARQCEAGLKLVRTVVKRASSFKFSWISWLNFWSQKFSFVVGVATFCVHRRITSAIMRTCSEHMNCLKQNIESLLTMCMHTDCMLLFSFSSY